MQQNLEYLMKSLTLIVKSQRGNSDGTKSLIHNDAELEHFILFCLDLLKTHSSNCFSFELTIRSFFIHKIKLEDTYICVFCRSETETYNIFYRRHITFA